MPQPGPEGTCGTVCVATMTAHPWHASNDAATLQDQLHRGFRAMTFDQALEPAYRDHEFRDGLRYLRINLILLVLLVLAIVQIDRIVMPAFSHAVPVTIRLGILLPVLLTAFALTFHRHGPTWYPRVIAVLMTVASIGIAWLGLVAWSQGENRIFVRLIIATIAVYFVMGLRFRLALVANLTTVGFYAIAAVAIWSMPALELTQYMAMVLMTSMICAAGAYNLEHARRTAWLEGRLLAEFALRDGLTGIANRRRLDEHLQQAWQQALRDRQPLALLFTDIDAFKAFNDQYGHQAGDEALKAVASVHARHSRRPLDLAARFGGEEFAVLLYGASRADAERIAETILGEVRALDIVHVGSSAAPVLTISAGIACGIPTAARQPADLLQLADRALYQAKHGGRNRAHVLEDPGMKPS